MEAQITAIRHGVKCRAVDLCEGEPNAFTLLQFTEEGGNVVSIYLPPKMSACASMIAGAFNAHLEGEPGISVREQVAAAEQPDRGRYIGLQPADAEAVDKVARAAAEGAPAE